MPDRSIEDDESNADLRGRPSAWRTFASAKSDSAQAASRIGSSQRSVSAHAAAASSRLAGRRRGARPARVPELRIRLLRQPRLVVTTLPITDRGEVMLIRRGIARASTSGPSRAASSRSMRLSGRRPSARRSRNGPARRADGHRRLYSRVQAAVVVVAFEARIVGGVPTITRESLETRPFAPHAIPWPEIAFETSVLALRDWVASVRRTSRCPTPQRFTATSRLKIATGA